MAFETDFKAMPSGGAVLVSVSVTYTLPDHPLLVNEFVWQTLDVAPSFPRVARFLRFWRHEIEGEIRSVLLGTSGVLRPASWSSPTYLKLD